MNDTVTGQPIYGQLNFPIPKSVVDNWCLVIPELYGFKDFRRLQAYIKLCNLRMRYMTPDNRNTEIFLETENLEKEVGLSEWMLKNFKKDLENKGLIKRAYKHIWNGVGWKGSQAYIKITEKGLALYWKIVGASKSKKNPVAPVEKKEHFSYTDEDVENAKFWFKSLRKFWRDYPGKLTQIGDWKEKWQPRANGMRKAREKVNMTPEGFRKILETIVKSDEVGFFFKTVIAPDAFCKKWKSGLTVAETMVDRCDEIWRKQEKQEQLQLSKEDVPVYPDKDGNDVEDVNVTNVWDSMWDVIGNHLSKKFKSKEQVDSYWDALIVLCEQIADRLHFRPGRIVLRDQHLSSSLRQDEMPNEASYFYFLLDKYRDWNGNFSIKMLWKYWMDFWNRILRLDRGVVTYEDMRQFEVEQYTMQED